MATWRLNPKHKKSFIEIESWKKDKLELVHDIVWHSGSLTVESITKPEIDLANKDGFDPDNNDYGYEFEFEESADGDGEYTYPDGLSAAEEAKLEELIENEGLEKAGWLYGGNEYYLIGELELTLIND
ncbi:hypothetical protein [Methylobacter sp. S3L5C]|uniref:hypothetical protein n=1 Tax=Methylobacter sp. S3L5C TaxID=2839024 RepID=UPI001FAB6594|nr:hypothetical protein [Methylobacter sp. S3L5C]UOA08750.1 hypothetical protein KKZ03_00015 [Methylobacter sp. S3L5C]